MAPPDIMLIGRAAGRIASPPLRRPRDVLGLDLGAIESVERAKTAKRVPVVLTRGEVRNVLDRMSGVPQLACWLLYGAGLRLRECLSLRVKDLDFERNEITVRDGKGSKDRLTMLPTFCRQDMQTHLQHVRQFHEEDLSRGYLFPASSFYTDRHTGIPHRHHLHETVIQRAMAPARPR